MARTIRNEKYSQRDMRFEDKRVGYAFEGCYKPEGIKFLKRLEHKHNRRINKRIVENEYV